MKFRDPIDWEETLPIRPSSPAWRATIRSIYGTPLDEAESKLFAELSGGRPPPDGGADEFLGVIGRRGGKSETIARLAVFEALHGGHEIALAPGQVGLIPVISPLREQSGEIIRYVKGLCELRQVKPKVAKTLADSVEFKTGIVVAVMTADAVNVSGPTVVTAIRDEWAKWPGAESACPDAEIENSLRPALAPVRGAPRRRLIGITSAYIREGLAFETQRDHFGVADAPVLVVRGSTDGFNPNVDRAWLARERSRVGDRVFAREYLAEWQDAVTQGWFGADVIEQCIDRGRPRSAPVAGVSYEAAIDAAFRGDLFALAIAHREAPTDTPARVVVDGVWTWGASGGSPLSVEATVSETAEILRTYGIASAFADQFSIDPLREAYSRKSIYLQEAPWTAATKPSRFGTVRGAMTSGLVRLPDDPALIREFHGIQGRLLRSGGEQIEARGSGRDDRVHAAVLVTAMAIEWHPDMWERKTHTTAPAPGSPEALDAEMRARKQEALRLIRRRHEIESRSPMALFHRLT